MRSHPHHVLSASVALLVSTLACADTPPFGTLQPQDTESMVREARELLSQQRTREAYLLLEQAKARGNAEAYRLLASLYEGGEGGGVKPVPFIARDFYWMGALSGDPESMYRVAQRYFNKGNEEDGEKWLVRAADRGHPGANLMLAQREFQRNDLANAQRHLKVALEAEYPEAKHFLVSLYEKGSWGFPKDFKQAFVVLDGLAKSGDAKAMHAMGFYFIHGLHGVKNDEAAAHWYHEAAKAGYSDSLRAYAWLAETGQGTEKDIAESRWYRQQAEKLPHQ